MAYTTEAKVKVLLTDVASVNAQFINMAETIINSKLCSRYNVPFVSVPPIIETLATDIAAYYCMRTLFTGDSQNKNEWIDSFKLSMDLLQEIADGKMPLLNSAGVEISTSMATMYSSNQNYKPIFDQDNIESQVVDSQRLEDISAERQ